MRHITSLASFKAFGSRSGRRNGSLLGQRPKRCLQFESLVARTVLSTVVVSFVTVDGSATVADSDYLANFGVVTFLPGQTSIAIDVAVGGNAIVEPDETFSLELSSVLGASILDGQGIGTILNDD